ncbi:MAG: FAD:protein transferase [Solirubrobacteraceae bacterium]|nr:FAD:protein transferase [Solirubrobacteraceae bacterium]
MLPVARWTALGTTVAVAVSDPRALRRARRAVEIELAAIDAACSRFRDDSELARLNAAAGRWVEVSSTFVAAITVALRAAELTDGAVDPTIGHALMLAGYDRDFSPGLIDRTRAISARRVPGWRTVRVDPARGRARVERGVALDLGATAKALAADRAAVAAAQCAPGASVLVNLGGDIATAGPPPPGGWLVRVADDHRAGPHEPGQSVLITLGALATSSTTVRRWGAAAHHIIDPSTGRPADSRWRTVSVAAASCVDANIASTAGIVRHDAPAWLAARHLPARLVDRAGAIVTVARWPPEAVAA